MKTRVCYMAHAFAVGGAEEMVLNLVQHLPDASTHIHTPGRFSDHEVRLAAGSLAAEAAGVDRLEVRSHHHQGAGRLGEGLEVSGWSDPGDTVEAIELPRDDGGWTLGILWHTEEEPGSNVMAAFCEAAARMWGVER